MVYLSNGMERLTIQAFMPDNKQESATKTMQPSEKSEAELHELRSKVSDLSSLIEVSIIINTTQNVDELVNLVMTKAQSVMRAEASSVMLLNEETNMLECEVALGEVGEKVKKIQLKMGEGIAGWVAQHGQPEIIPDVSTDERFASKIDNSTGFQTRSILAAPLLVKEKVIGVAEVINRLDGKAFDNDDLELFSTFCRQVAMAIENARMYQMKLEKQRLEQDLEHARIIQQSFMPEVFPSGTEKAFSIFAKSLPAAAVGGDFFDFHEFGNSSVGVAVGDVTGKGVPAALYMARLVSDLRRYTQICVDPAEVIIQLNKALIDRSRRGMFVTFQYGILQSETGYFTYANAGHLPFIRVSKDKDVEMLKGGKTIPLGIVPDVYLDAVTVKLEPGDSIVLITDGIVEAKSRDGKAYSIPRTVRTLAGATKTAKGIVEELLADVQAFAKGVQQHDDLTILSITWTK